MIKESYELVTYNPSKRIYEAVKKIPKGCVATYGQIARWQEIKVWQGQ